MKLLEGFITEFSDSHFVLTKANSEYYHKIHSIMLYFIFLVYIIYQNLEKSLDAKNLIEEYVIETASTDNNNEHICHMKKRLEFVDNINYSNFKKYRARLDLFFQLF